MARRNAARMPRTWSGSHVTGPNNVRLTTWGNTLQRYLMTRDLRETIGTCESMFCWKTACISIVNSKRCRSSSSPLDVMHNPQPAKPNLEYDTQNIHEEDGISYNTSAQPHASKYDILQFLPCRTTSSKLNGVHLQVELLRGVLSAELRPLVARPGCPSCDSCLTFSRRLKSMKDSYIIFLLNILMPIIKAQLGICENAKIA